MTLAQAGVHIRFFDAGLLHTKTVTVDDELCLIGSVNLDMRSFWLNFEVTMFVYDRAFAAAARAMQEQYADRSTTVCLKESWAPFGPILRVMRWLGKAPMVKLFSKKTLNQDIENAGFVDLQEPEVGAEKVISFLSARKPAS